MIERKLMDSEIKYDDKYLQLYLSANNLEKFKISLQEFQFDHPEIDSKILYNCKKKVGATETDLFLTKIENLKYEDYFSTPQLFLDYFDSIFILENMCEFYEQTET